MSYRRFGAQRLLARGVKCAALVYMLGLLLTGLVAAQAEAPSDQATVTAALLSDPHLDPFRDPAKARRLAAAPVAQWAAILAEPPSAGAESQFATLQKTCSEKLPDADASLEMSALDDAAAAHPAVVLVGGDMLAHAFGCRYRTLLDPGGTDTVGLADFAAKTIEYQLLQMQQRFPNTPIHLALGNNDTDCDDYALDEDSRFLRRLGTAVAAGWSGVTPRDRTTAKQDFERFGSYALPLSAAVPDARVIVLDDLYLSSDYRGTCAKQPAHSSAAGLLTWLRAQLADAKRAHQAVWILAHIPPEVNIYRTYLHPHDICHGEPPATFFADEAVNKLLTQYADTVRVFISGHTHVDEIHLLQGGSEATGSIALKTIPSVSPVSTNPPAFLMAQIDPKTATLVDYTKRIASVSPGVPPHWATAYVYRKRYAEPAFTAEAVADLLHRWQSEPDASASQIDNYQASIASGLRLFALRATWPQQLCAMQHSSAAGFTECACSATGGMLPPAQKVK